MASLSTEFIAAVCAIAAAVHLLQAQDCDCFDVILDDVYEYQASSDIYCYQYLITTDTTKPTCRSVTKLSIAFGIDESHCFLNEIELGDVVIDTTPPVWHYQVENDADFPALAFKNIPIQLPSNSVTICVDGTQGFITEAPLRLTMDEVLSCDEFFPFNVDFCGLYMFLFSCFSTIFHGDMLANKYNKCEWKYTPIAESYDCALNPTCYCFDEESLCQQAPAEFGKLCVWDADNERCVAVDEETPTTTDICKVINNETPCYCFPTETECDLAALEGELDCVWNIELNECLPTVPTTTKAETTEEDDDDGS